MNPDRGEHTREPVSDCTTFDGAQLVESIRAWGSELGFAQIGIADLQLDKAAERLHAWLAEGRHGTMQYMERHALLRAQPQRLLPGALRAITARMDYLPQQAAGWAERELQRLREPDTAVVSLYARGRDYHKVLRSRLQALAERIESAVGNFAWRVATDSAPVFETELASKSGIGWRGKHTLLLSQDAGSMFFLGEILTDLPLPVDPPTAERCGSCSRCLEACPTGAITGPYQLDARRCISYLTIEHAGLDPGSAATFARQPHLRLRRLPVGVPVEQVRAHRVRAGLRGAQRTGRGRPVATLRVERRGIRLPPGRLADPPHRLRTLAAQHRGCSGQRTGDGRSHRCAARPAGLSKRVGTRACAVGIGAPRSGRRHCGARLIAIGSVTIASNVCTVIA